MGYHAINEGGAIPVYWNAALDTSFYDPGTLYNGEVCTVIGRAHEFAYPEVKYLNKDGKYVTGFVQTDANLGNLAYSGKSVNVSALGGTCYRFKLRKSLKVVTTGGNAYTTLSAGDYIYTNGATCGESTPANMYIIGYKKGTAAVKSFKGFVTLDYTNGSMFASNFCLYNG